MLTLMKGDEVIDSGKHGRQLLLIHSLVLLSSVNIAESFAVPSTHLPTTLYAWIKHYFLRTILFCMSMILAYSHAFLGKVLLCFS